MPTPWLKRIRKTGQLTVFNKATAWADSVTTAITSFNNLPLGVKLVAEKEEKSANIVLILASGPQQYKYYGDTAKTFPDFKGDRLHGETRTLIDGKLNEIFFAVVFLPGKVKKATKGQKEVIVVHEFEYIPDKGAKPMPPIRVGPQTLCKMRMLWSGAKDCKDD